MRRPIREIERDKLRMPIRRSSSYADRRLLIDATNQSRALVRPGGRPRWISDGRDCGLHYVPATIRNNTKSKDTLFSDANAERLLPQRTSTEKPEKPWNSFLRQLQSRPTGIEAGESDEEVSGIDIANTYLKKYTFFHEARNPRVADSAKPVGASTQYHPSSATQQSAGIKRVSTAPVSEFDCQHDELSSISKSEQARSGLKAHSKTEQRSVADADWSNVPRQKLARPALDPIERAQANGNANTGILGDLFEEVSTGEYINL